MAARITSINKADCDHENPYVAITALGWLNEATGQVGKSAREEIYNFIEHQNGEAYVIADSARARVVTATSPRGTRYVKTEADSTQRDNLLKLMECR
jgi:hypothetical protein